MRFTAALLFLAAPLHAAEPVVLKDVSYAEPKNERQALDVYSPPGAKNRPIVFWVHGGGWRAGDKKGFQKKALAFVDKGYVFVATNYRFRPTVTVKEMTGDIAKAIRWAHEHAKEFGGDPNAIVVMGHSAGAQLAALVCTDDRYLKAEKVPLSALRGCVPVDCSFYDIPKRVKDGGTTPLKTITDIFTDAEETQRDYSAAAHVAKGKDIPPFLILHVATRDDTKAQAQWLADKLKGAGVAAKVVAAADKTHGSIGSDLGQRDDAPTTELFEFLGGVLKK
jgi:acetyl esterase/lipase